ncbi:hypothetical protein [Streptomyces sp. NPDC057199]|uniref:hypothetical protein n=1 Tax=Streptomyces sp. NPDC057199 TaxID=3346047 RepID=UPI00363C0EA5
MLGAATHVVGRLQKMGGSWNPYNLPFYQEHIKLPIGTLTAVIGLLLVDTEWLPMIESPQSWRDVMACAVVFGLAQIALTRTIDQRAEKILASEPDTEGARQQGAEAAGVRDMRFESPGTEEDVGPGRQQPRSTELLDWVSSSSSSTSAVDSGGHSRL